MKEKVSDAEGSFTMKENCPWEGMPWHPPDKLEEGSGKVQVMTLVSKDVRYTKQIQFNGFLCNSFVMYNSECWEVLVKTGNSVY